MFDLASPTPLASLLSSVATLAVFAVIYLLLRQVTRRRDKNAPSFIDRLITGARAVDRVVVYAASWIVGTRYERPWVRRLAVVAAFLGFAVAGALLPWPWGLVAITVGVLGIFVVFRHWSRDEHEALFELPIERKDIKIRGDLAVEVTTACGFLLVFASVAFAQLQANGYGFEVHPGAGPFTFFVYTVIETLKAGSLVAYYDLFAEQLGYEQITRVRSPTDQAKWAVLGYRISLNLLILATLKRLLDIAWRRAEGLDLRHIEEMLRGQDEAEQKQAVEQLKAFALVGRGNAPLLLERILTPSQSDDWTFGPDVRSRAAWALYEYGERRGGTGAFYAAVAAYRRLLRENWIREAMPSQWAMTQNNLGIVLASLGGRESGTARLEEAAAAFRAALEVRTHEAMPADWAATQRVAKGMLSCGPMLCGWRSGYMRSLARVRG